MGSQEMVALPMLQEVLEEAVAMGTQPLGQGQQGKQPERDIGDHTSASCSANAPAKVSVSSARPRKVRRFRHQLLLKKELFPVCLSTGE